MWVKERVCERERIKEILRMRVSVRVWVWVRKCEDVCADKHFSKIGFCVTTRCHHMWELLKVCLREMKRERERERESWREMERERAFVLWAVCSVDDVAANCRVWSVAQMTENSECDLSPQRGRSWKTKRARKCKKSGSGIRAYFFFELQKIEKGSAMTMSSIKKINL